MSPTSSTKVKGVIFVCDVSSLARNASVVAEHLQLVMQGLLAADESGRGTVPLLVLGHKADLLPKTVGGVNAQAAVQRVRTILERELERRRRGAGSGASGVAAMAGLGEEEGGGGGSGVGAGLDITGDEKEVFTFEKWEGGEVDLRASWVDVKRSSDGHTTDDEEHEGEKSEVKGEDGLAGLVQWIVDLR
jgi:signal recognition particle receptor subunit beta